MRLCPLPREHYRKHVGGAQCANLAASAINRCKGSLGALTNPSKELRGLLAWCTDLASRKLNGPKGPRRNDVSPGARRCFRGLSRCAQASLSSNATANGLSTSRSQPLQKSGTGTYSRCTIRQPREASFSMVVKEPKRKEGHMQHGISLFRPPKWWPSLENHTKNVRSLTRARPTRAIPTEVLSSLASRAGP